MHRVSFGQRRTFFVSKVRQKTCGRLADAAKQKTSSKHQHKYSQTVLLPRTQFAPQLNGKKLIERDENLAQKCNFAHLYEWQRKNLPEPDFVLHDGPPYANGVPHMGHAINKILKDITLRSKVIRGCRVHYIPGWDCHGLPIELKAVDSTVERNPLLLRQKSRIYAKEAAEKQREAFQSWGVMANWTDSGCYFTNHTSYMKNQLIQFINLYEKGIIFRDFMPVYWSPSSRTALAESELEYRNHQSKSVIVRLRVDNLSAKLNSFKDRKVYALTWTTTPWTLVANQALAFSANATYCLAEDNQGNLNILGEEMLQSIESKIGPLKLLARMRGSELEGSTYFYPFEKKTLPFLPGRHVKMDVGTGLVHTAPAHGPEDFLVALENNIHTLSMVDNNGRYTEVAGPEFCGLKALTEGTDKVLDLLATDILCVEALTHSYPYDWRTKQPVLIRASNQWFININSIRQNVIDKIGGITIHPECNRTAFTNALLAGVKERPYWCISRQRSWGTPIPVLYSKKAGEPLTSRALVERLCASIDHYGPDCWWEYSAQELIGLDVLEGLNVAPDDVQKGQDIMDIWFDSGISWSAVVPEGKADLYMEGRDQLNGWFQSSLLTSVALQGCAPYRALFVHGFAVDEDRVKMSKSTGNVINPEELLLGGSDLRKRPAYGVDVLRWWVANHGCQHTQVPVSKDLIEGSKQSINKLRLVLRFLLGISYPYYRDGICEPQYRVIDKYMLHLLYCYNEQMQQHYNSYEYHHAGKTIMHFVANNVSALYCHLIKDRLYCDEITSPSRIAAVEVAKRILTVLARTIAPILPHLAEEVWLHHPDNQASIPLHHTAYQVPESWNDLRSVEECLNPALRLRNTLLNNASVNTWQLTATVEATKSDFPLLSLLHNTEESSTSELCEILQLSSIKLIESNAIAETAIHVTITDKIPCERCRRYPETQEEQHLCSRCAGILAKDESVAAKIA